MITTGVVCREFIGRRHELAFLVEQLERAREHLGSTILVAGEAGIGKSRLIDEFCLAATARGVTPLTAACYEIGDAPYAPLLELAEGLGARAAVAALHAQSFDDEPTGRERTRRFAAFAAALAACVHDTTVVAVIENLHWADSATLELLRYVSTGLKQQRFVLIGTLRTDDDGAREATVAQHLADLQRSADATVRLHALGPPEMRRLLNSALRDDGRRVSAPVIDAIAELSEGRPFHAEELLRGMLDRGPAARAAIPPSLAAAVHDRLKSLPESDREVLAYAAVIGRHFAAAFLAELAGLPLAAVLLTLRRARNLQLIAESADGDAFLFRHQLTREVVYAEILIAEARGLHLRIAEKLEAYPQPDVTAIAYHAWRSGDAALAQRWNEAAGDAARALDAHTDAIRHYHRAQAAAGEPAACARLAAKLARALYAVGDLDGAAGWFAQTVGAATIAGNLPLAHRAALDRALALSELGRPADGIAAAKAVTVALAGEDSALRYAAETLTASLLNAHCRSEEALLHLDIASRLACAPEPGWAVRHQGIRAHTLSRLGRLAQSQAEFAIAVAGARALGEREGVVRALNNWADVLLRIGDLPAAAAHYADALAVARELRSSRLIAWLIANNAYTSLFRGEFSAALSSLDELADIEHDIESVWINAQAIAFRLGTLRGDDALLRRVDIDAAFARALALGAANTIGLTAGAKLAGLIRTGVDPASFVAAAIDKLDGAADVFWFADGVARAAPAFVPAARTLLAGAAADAQAHAAGAHLLLFDARVALRERRKADAERLAAAAGVTFARLGWAVETAYAYEVGGRLREAVAAFRDLGATAEVQRLVNIDEHPRRRRGATTLTAREREIAALIRSGKSNREVAQRLVISERTVETHVAAVYHKFGVTSRGELSALLDAVPAPT